MDLEVPVKTYLAEHLNGFRYASPITLFTTFLLAFCYYTIRYSRYRTNKVETNEIQYGPGGKPLPRKKPLHSESSEDAQVPLDFSRGRKRLFRYLLGAATLTFLANAAVVTIRVVAQRKDGWWCGEPYTVRAEIHSGNDFDNADVLPGLCRRQLLRLLASPHLRHRQ